MRRIGFVLSRKFLSVSEKLDVGVVLRTECGFPETETSLPGSRQPVRRAVTVSHESNPSRRPKSEKPRIASLAKLATVE